MRFLSYVCCVSATVSGLMAEAPAAASGGAAVNPATAAVPRGEWVVKHESFNKISREGKAPLVFLGDSITEAWLKVGRPVWDRVWAPMGAVNFGIGGDRVEHLLWRLRNGNCEGLKPKLVVLMIGTNNTGHTRYHGANEFPPDYHCTPEQTVEGVKAVLEHLKMKLPETRVLVLSVLPRGEKPGNIFRQDNDVINAAAAKMADGQRVFYKDIGGIFLQPDGVLSREVMPDLLHLSVKGYEMWAGAIEAEVKRLMALE
jgi:lysophospholipase L1-like esterase